MPLWILVSPTVQTLPGVLQVSQCLGAASALLRRAARQDSPDEKLVVDLPSVSPPVVLLIQPVHAFKAPVPVLPDLGCETQQPALCVVLQSTRPDPRWEIQHVLPLDTLFRDTDVKREDSAAIQIRGRVVREPEELRGLSRRSGEQLDGLFPFRVECDEVDGPRGPSRQLGVPGYRCRTHLSALGSQRSTMEMA